MRAWREGAGWWAAALAVALPWAVSAPAAEKPLITDPAQLWALSSEEKSVAHPISLEGQVSYVDPRWRHLWIERDEVGTYVQLSSHPPALPLGQRIRIEGSIIPLQGLDANSVTVTTLEPAQTITPIELAGQVGNVTGLNSRVVTARAFVDFQQLIDDDHLRLALIIDDQPATAYVKPDNPRLLPDWQGHFVQITGLYQGRFDPTNTQLTVELWTGRQSDVVVQGSMEDSELFALPIVPIGELPRVPAGQRVRLRGHALASEPGSALVVRDDTGQVVVHSSQQQRVAFDSLIEAVGRVDFENSHWSLRAALFRVVGPGSDVAASERPSDPAVLRRVGQIRALSVEDAGRSRPVRISGVVTWSLPSEDFFFLEDLTGGVRVRFDPRQLPPPPRNKYLEVEGVTYNGGFAPAVQLTAFRDLGAMSSPPTKEVTFDQAITGEEDGQLVAMRGFYRATDSEGEIRRVHVTTPGGEFVGLLVSPVNFAPTPGSLVRVHGPCEVVADHNGRISGVVVRVPSLAGLTVEEDAPANPYDLPLHSVKHLRQLSTARDLTRVRVTGTVLHAVPGRHVYLQQENSALLLHSRETSPLAPGDEIEAVGILGREGVRTILREAVYRKQRSGPAPTPVPLHEPARLLPELDSRLVVVRSVLIGTLRRPTQLRLTLQSEGTLFEATLEGTAADEPAPKPGTGLALTGIYRIGFDDSQQLRSFQLHLRSPADITVYQKPRLWTLQRALLASGILGGCSLIGIAWVIALRRRVRRQTEQIRAQLERQAQLEAEVQRATRLESLGVLAGGIAHDFNNLLTIVMGNLGLAMLDEKVMAAVGDSLRACERGASRARDLTQQLLTFAKGGSPLRAAVSLSTVVRETTTFTLHGSNVRSEYDFGPDLWTANVDKDQISQVIQNLVLNAVQAMPRGGVIRISLHNAAVAAGENRHLAAGRYLRLSITDTGCGIRPEILPRIFDPYFSTKRTGTGLGLATVYSIVKKHEGHILAESEPGVGSTFTLWLAAANTPTAPTAAPLPQAPVEPAAAERPARVLLMDDEAAIRQIGAALLQRMRIETTVAADGEEALRAFAAAHGTDRAFDLVILDLTIPGGLGGRETMERIRTIDPRVPAIVSSGYSNDPVLADLKRYGFHAMVSKPYDVNQLATTVRRLLATSQREPQAATSHIGSP